uniref:PELP1 middle domain-containing protein n=1 Tax=Eptatretus burgeri TaxID=7764 RepID=A0A8C4NPG7_EPTBU
MQRRRESLKGLLSCLKFFPRGCGNSRGKLESIFLLHLDADDPTLREMACKGLAGICRLPIRKTQGSQSQDGWQHLVQALLGALYDTLSLIYPHNQLEEFVYEAPPLLLPELNLEGPWSSFYLARRITSLTSSLTTLLSDGIGHAVPVLADDFLTFVCQALSVTPNHLLSKQNVQDNNLIKMAVLPGVHMEALRLLEAVIKSCGKRLLPHSDTINALFPQVLSTWTFDASATRTTYSAVKIVVYQALGEWLLSCGISGGLLQGQKQHDINLLSHLLNDITPKSSEMQLKLLAPSTGKVGSGPRKRAREPSRTSLPDTDARGDNGVADLCRSALCVLIQLVMSSGTILPVDIHQKMQELVVGLAATFPTSCHPPYNSPHCRERLLRLMLQLVLSPTSKLPPPLQPALRLFSLLQHDHSHEVSSFCREALCITNALIHPRTRSQHPTPAFGWAQSSPSQAPAFQLDPHPKQAPVSITGLPFEPSSLSHPVVTQPPTITSPPTVTPPPTVAPQSSAVPLLLASTFSDVPNFLTASLDNQNEQNFPTNLTEAVEPESERTDVEEEYEGRTSPKWHKTENAGETIISQEMHEIVSQIAPTEVAECSSMSNGFSEQRPISPIKGMVVPGKKRKHDEEDGVVELVILDDDDGDVTESLEGDDVSIEGKNAMLADFVDCPPDSADL